MVVPSSFSGPETEERGVAADEEEELSIREAGARRLRVEARRRGENRRRPAIVRGNGVKERETRRCEFQYPPEIYSFPSQI